MVTSFRDLRNSDSEFGPFNELRITDFANDFELPGLPTRNRGIRNEMQTTIIKTFSRRALFLAIFLPNFILSKNTSWQL